MPAELEVVVRDEPVPSATAVTLAPTITPPVGSLTVPWMVAAVRCASTGTASQEGRQQEQPLLPHGDRLQS